MHLPLNALVRIVGSRDLGPGRLTGFDGVGRAQVRLIWTATEVAVDPNNDMERYELFPGTPVALKRSGKVGALHAIVTGQADRPKDGHWIYPVRISGEERKKNSDATVSEADLEPLRPVPVQPLDHLRCLAWDSSEQFLRRWTLRLIESGHIGDTGGIPALLGARITPMGHQMYAVRRVLWDRVPRFILADEVGLGKTVEAGLIIQALRTFNADLRVLVLAPGSMARQWQTELYLRFGALPFSYIDGVTWGKASTEERRRLLTRQHLIVTTTLLQAIPAVQQILKTTAWDLLVIDEAHQYPPGSGLYEFFHEIARKTHGVLALSATPSKRELLSLSGLLSLVSPDVYSPKKTDALTQRIDKQRGIWDRLSFTRKTLDAAKTEGKALEAEDLTFLADEWSGLIPEDSVVENLLSQMRAGVSDAAEQLVAYVQEFHRLDHRIIRTRRSTLQKQPRHWSERRVVELSYEISNAEALVVNHLDALPAAKIDASRRNVLRGLYYRMFAETPSRLLNFLQVRRGAFDRGPTNPTHDFLSLLSADPSPADEAVLIDSVARSAPPLTDELTWLNSAIGLVEEWIDVEPICGKVRALADYLSQSGRRQSLIFAQDQAVVEELCKTLSELVPGVSIKPFHYGLEETVLAKTALDFQRNRSCQILVSDELGGEGRNFQNADAVVHFDVPWSVARIEQRIGRLDRVGRGAVRPVLSVLCCGPTPLEAALRHIHKEAFRVYTRSVGGLEYALPKLQMKVTDAVCKSPAALIDLAGELQALIDKELSDVDEAFDLSLDASKVQLRDAQELAQILDEPGDPHSEGVAFAKWANRLGIQSRKRGATWEFQWDQDSLLRPLEGLPEKHLVAGTFNRARALNDESEQFFGPGHPLVDGVLRDLAKAPEGRASVIGAQLGDTYVGRWFALILCRCRPGEKEFLSKEISPGLRLRAARHSWPQIGPVLVELHPGKEVAATIVKDARLTTLFRGPNTISAAHKEIPANLLGASIDTADLWAAVEEAIQIGERCIAERRSDIAKNAAASLRDDLSPEIGFLRWQRANSGTKGRRTLDKELTARDTLIDSVEREEVDIDAVAIVVGVK
jgi:ATP-dependent helicase HepA